MDGRKDLQQGKGKSSSNNLTNNRGNAGTSRSKNINNNVSENGTTAPTEMGDEEIDVEITGTSQTPKKQRQKSGPRDVLNKTMELSDDTDEDDDDDYEDFSYRADSPLELVDRNDLAQHQQSGDRIPLIPTDFTSIQEAMQNFTAVFESRYGANHAPFYEGSLQKAIADAFDTSSIGDRRPLALYIHHDDSVAAHIFPQTVLCSMEVSNLLKCQFLVWAWDITQHQNKQTLLEWLNLVNLSEVVDLLRVLSPSKFPIIVLLCKERGKFQQNGLIYGGEENVTNTIQKLMICLDSYETIRQQGQQEERNRLEREQFRQEQAEEYQRSLAADKAKHQELQRKKKHEIEEGEKKRRNEEEKQNRLKEIAKILLPEPAESDPLAMFVRFRCPNGELRARRFSSGESVEMLVLFTESIGFERTHFRLWTSDRPRKEISSMDTTKSFKELKWPKREQITIEEI